jgi:O-antigen/teichoic acid export membrane protein
MKIMPLFIQSSWVAASGYAMYGAMFIATILINRTFGTAELGRFGLAWAVAQLTVQAAVSGFGAIHKRDVSFGRESIQLLVTRTLTVRLASVFSIILVAGFSLHVISLPWPVTVAILLMISAKSIEAIGMAFAETIQAAGGNKIYAALTAFNAAMFLAAILLVWAFERESRMLYYAMAASAAAFTIVAFALFVRSYGAVRLGEPVAKLAHSARESWPLIANAVVYVLAGRAAIIVVAALAGETAAGAFAFASGVVGGVAVIAGAIGTVMFPELCRMFVVNPGALRGRVYSLFWTLSGLGLGLYMLLILARWPIVSIYGNLPDYAADVLLALGAGLIATFASVSTDYMFTVIGKQKESLYLAAANAALVLLLVLSFTHFLGTLGAALGVSLSQALMCLVSLLWLDRRHLVALRSNQEVRDEPIESSSR